MTNSSDMLPVVYDRLRTFARLRFNTNDSLTGTALVHEAYLKVTSSSQQWNDLNSFFGAIRNAMRNAMVDHIRRNSAQKRGSTYHRIDNYNFEGAVPLPEIVDLNDALECLALEDERAANVVTLRFFACMTDSEISEALGISLRTVNRDWTYARAWLRKKLSENP